MGIEDKIKISVCHFKEMINEMADGEDINVGEFLDSISIATAMFIFSTCKDKGTEALNTRVNDFCKTFNGLVRSTIIGLVEERGKTIN